MSYYNDVSGTLPISRKTPLAFDQKTLEMLGITAPDEETQNGLTPGAIKKIKNSDELHLLGEITHLELVFSATLNHLTDPEIFAQVEAILEIVEDDGCEVSKSDITRTGENFGDGSRFQILGTSIVRTEHAKIIWE